MSPTAMQQTKSTPAGSNAAALSMTLADARADGAARFVRLSRERVTIDRSFRGVAMRLSIPVEAYRGVCVGIKPREEGGVTYELSLAHRDADLSVSLVEAPDDSEIWADWRSWAAFFGLPTLIERNEGLVEWGHAPGRVAPPAAPTAAASKRRVKRRRAAFLTRRYATCGAMGPVHHEDEIIARD